MKMVENLEQKTEESRESLIEAKNYLEKDEFGLYMVRGLCDVFFGTGIALSATADGTRAGETLVGLGLICMGAFGHSAMDYVIYNYRRKLDKIYRKLGE